MLGQSDRGSRRNLRRPLGWAAFLGASWTWCIGMFLPVLLVRDYGLWAFVAFAIPNVLGAAAMGWVVRDANAGTRLLRPHLPAAVAFSLVTIAFHVFFLACVAMPVVGSWFVLPIALLAGGLAWFAGDQFRGGWLIAAAVVLAISVVLCIALGAMGGLSVPTTQGQLPTLPLLWLVPVMVFGFALCPYLDLTFHRARQALTPAEGRMAFGVGFGAFFLLMIVMTLLYASLVISRFASTSAPATSLAVWFVALHMAIQSGFTIALHLRYAVRRLDAIGPERTTILISAAVALLIGGIILAARGTTYRGLGGAELGYRAFMAFYGLVFPAYVWLCMIPSRGGAGAEAVPARAVRTFAVAVLVAAPMFWMGFIERRTIWLLPGVALVLAARLALNPRRGEQPPPPVTAALSA